MSDAERSRGGTPAAAGSSSMSRVNSFRGATNGGGGQSSKGGEGTSTPSAAWFEERQRSPEPDEDLNMDEKPTAWLVKVPRFLYEGWSKVQQDDLNLGTVRVYDADHRGRQRIELILPSAPDAPIPLPEYDPATAGRNVKRIPRKYDVKLSNDSSETMKRNIFAFRAKAEGEGDDEDDDDDVEIDDADEDIANAASERAAPTPSRNPYRRRKRQKISTAFAGKITNEAAVKPILSSLSNASEASVKSRGQSPATAGGTPTSSGDVKPNVGAGPSGTDSNAAAFTPEYREILRRRKDEASKPRRTVKMLDESQSAANNLLAAGMGQGHLRGKAGQQPASFIVNQGDSGPSGRAQGGARSTASKDKFARIPKNELLDLLFGCYERYTYWTLRALREETRQPEAYLREVLSGIADQHKRGPYVGQWSLKAEYIQQRKEEEAAAKQQQQQQQQMAQAANAGGQAPTAQASGEEAAAGGEEEDDDEMEEVI